MVVEVSGKFIYCFDLDETLCRTNSTDYANSTVIQERIKFVNELYDSGNHIKIFTARGSETGIDWSSITKQQLSEWGLSYHELIFGKPAADFYIDDKAQSDKDFFKHLESS